MIVTAIIPCRNEEKLIAKCLLSIIENDYPKDELEILVVDGLSEDETKTIVERYEKKYPFIEYLKNEKKIIPAAMNIGIAKAKGDVIMKMDAHATYQKDYISQCVHYLTKYNADNVGGILITRPRENTSQAKAIALCLSHPFGAGSSPFRSASASKIPQEVDTVAFGCYRRNVFKRIGLYNENLIGSSDMDLNIRLKKAGGKILLAPEVIAYYYPESTFKKFFTHNIRDGIWALYPYKFTRGLLRPRHLVPLAFVLMVLFFPPLFFPYFFISFIASAHIALRERDARYIVMMPIAFFIRHFVYGIGSLWGLIKIIGN